MMSGEAVPVATAEVDEATAVRAVTAGTATSDPTAPIVRTRGAITLRRMGMIPPCVYRGQMPLDLATGGGPHELPRPCSSFTSQWLLTSLILTYRVRKTKKQKERHVS